MAVELNVGDVVQVRLNFRDQLLTTAYNVLHYRLATANPVGGGDFNGADFADVGPQLAEAAANKFAASWPDGASEKVDMVGTTVWDVWPEERSAGYHHLLPAPVPGQIVGDALPLQDSVTILKRTAFGARWGLGRVFFVGLGEAAQAGGVLNQQAVTDLNPFIVSLSQNLVVADPAVTYTFRPVLHTVDKDPVLEVRTLDIVSFDLSDPIVKTQRRRRPGKGI